MPFRQQFWVGDGERIWKEFWQVVMVGDEHIHAVCAGVIHCCVGSDAGIAGQDEFCAALNDFLQVAGINPVALAFPHRDMKSNIGMQFLESLNENGRGGLAIRIEIAPNTDGCVGTNGFFQMIGDGR